MRVDGGAYSVIVFGLTDTSYTITGLTLGTTYEFTVESQNLRGYSPTSDSITILHAIQPDPPINLIENLVHRSYTTLGISWSDGVSDGGSDVLDYRVWMQEEAGTFTELISGLTEQTY